MKVSYISCCAALALAYALAGCSGAAAPHMTPQAERTSARAATHAAAAYGLDGVRAVFEHSLVCDNGILIANYAKKYGIGTIFVPVGGDDLSSLLAGNPTTVKNLQAMMAVAKVYMVSGDVSWLSTPTTLPADVPSLAKIAGMYPQLAGIYYAVDPELSPQWNGSGRKALIQQYFTLVQTLLSAPQAAAFAQTWFLAHTDFATNQGTNGSSMLQQLQAAGGVTGVDVLDGGNTAQIQFQNITPALPQLDKPFWVEANAGRYDRNSYYGKSPSYLKSNLAQLRQQIQAQNANLAGIDANGWSDLYDSLQSVLPQPPVFTGVLASGPLVPSAGTTYLGEYINPNGTGQTAPGTLAFEKSLGRTLAYNLHFYGFKEKFPGKLEADDVARGRLPIEAWNCGDTDANVVAGADDAIINAKAAALKSFGHPIMVRWFWEPNLDDTNDAPRTQCYDPNTDLPNGYFSPAEYIAAWHHVHDLFVKAGATNVIWLWCTANAHGGPSQYYPGDDVVDWVGYDDYDDFDVSMDKTFFISQNELSQFQEKPMMITETGAHASAQSVFLTGAAGVLKNNYPWVRAIGYLDSKGSHQDWVLSQTGLALFKTFASDPYMSAMPSL